MKLNSGSTWLATVVGSHPAKAVFVSVLVFLLSLTYLYFRRPDVVLSFDHGYTSPDASSIRELQAQVDFFGNIGEPWYMALFGQPVNGSMTSSKEFYELEKFYKGLKTNITIREDENGNPLNYLAYCGPMCDFNKVLFTTYNMAFWGLGWPVANVFGYRSNIGKHFFMREMKDAKIESSQLSALYFMVFINSTSMREDIREFERLVGQQVNLHNKKADKKVIFTQHSARGMELEIARGTQIALQRILIGFVVFFVFTAISLVVLNRVNERCNVRVLILIATATLVPLMALVCAGASFTLLGKHLNSIIFLSPAAILPLALDGILVLYYNWLLNTNYKSQKDLNSEGYKDTFKEILSPVVLIMTTCFALSVAGFFSPIPEISNLCIFLAISILFVFFFQMFFFAPFMRWASPILSHKKLSDGEGTCSQECNSDFWKRMTQTYSDVLTKPRILAVFSLLIVVALLFGCVFGYQKAEGNLDYRHLLSPDSPNNQGVHFMSDVVWPEFLHFLFIFQSPPDFSRPEEYERYLSFVEEISTIPGYMNKDADMVWINDFKRYADVDDTDNSLNMTLFERFINDDIYKAWQSGVRYEFDSEGRPKIKKMVYMAGIEGIKTMADKARVVAFSRQIVHRYPEFSIEVFDTEVGMTDVVMQLPFVLIRVPLFIFASQAIVFGFMSLSIVVSLVYFLTCLSLFTATVYLSALLGMTFNPFSVAFLVFVACLTPKVASHLCFFYVKNQEDETMDRINGTLCKSLLPTLLSSIVSGCLFLPVLGCSIVIFAYLAIINVIFLLLSLLFCFLLLPVTLSLLPSSTR